MPSKGRYPLARILENIARDESLDMDEDTRGDLKETASSLMEYQDMVYSYIKRADNVRDYLEDQRSDRMCFPRLVRSAQQP